MEQHSFTARMPLLTKVWQ